MTPVENDEFSHWDSLASELGLGGEPPVAPPKPTAPVPLHREISPPVREQPSKPIEVVSHFETVAPEEPVAEEVFGADPDAIATADTVLEDDEEGADGEYAGDTSEGDAGSPSDGKDDGKGRRRRRRRRKKKSGNEPAVGESNEAPQAEPVPHARPKPPVIEVAASKVEIIDEDTEEVFGEEDVVHEPTSAMEEALTEQTARASQEWKVVSWTDLVAGLHRP